MASAALVVVGLILVILGLFAAGNITLVGLGIVSLVAGGILQVLAMRRGPSGG